MKKNYKLWLSCAVIILLHSYATAQTALGPSKLFLSEIKNNLVAAKTGKPDNAVVALRAADKKEFKAKINFKKSEAASEILMGEINNIPNSTFYLKVNSNSVEGHIMFKDTKEAYKYYSDEKGNAFVSKVDINSLICIDYKKAPQELQSQTSAAPAAAIAPALLDLQSFPGAAGCVMLDFDGYFMPAGNQWNNGNSIDARPSGLSDADVQLAWEIASEDYRPFSVNITTNESVFNSYPKNRRMRVVITPTNTAAPGSGGVAYIGSFNANNDVPCWVFNLGGRVSGETISHEVGHTFDLGHDGRSNPNEIYYAGVEGTTFAPIMGASFYRPVSHWSRGEYDRANNKQDDVATIAGTKFGVGFRGDDYSNGTGGAANLAYGADGGITYKTGLITNEGDIDFFSFKCGKGQVKINANTVYREGNLDIILRLYTSTGAQIGTFTNTANANLSANLVADLDPGTYYVSVDGTGAGNPANGGYSAYASIGSYNLTGYIPPGSGPTSTTGLVTAYADCPYAGFSIALEPGNYNAAKLQSLGMGSNVISSIIAAEGYEVVLYDSDNFDINGGTLVTGTNSCLDVNSFNDRTTSLIVRTKGNPNITGNYYLQNRSSNLYMDVSGGPGATQDAANIQQYSLLNATNQRFKFTHLGDGTYKITAVHSGKAVDVSGISKNDGANVFQYTYYGTANQQFILVPTNNGYYKLIAKHSGKVVEVSGCSGAIEANVQQWSNNGQVCSEWKLIAAPASAAASASIPVVSNAAAGAQQNQTVSDAASFKIYPNPVGNTLTFSTNMYGTVVKILNHAGVLVAEQKVNNNNAVNISQLNAGMYLMVTYKNGKQTVQKFVKK
jgi:hypothetical protein